MSNSLSHIEQPTATPEVADVDFMQPLVWLKHGWEDLLHASFSSLSYGVIFALGGFLIMKFTQGHPALFTAAISGFFLIAPLLSTGLYDLSRRIAEDKPPTLRHSVSEWNVNGRARFNMGALLALAALAWHVISTLLFQMFYEGEAPQINQFVREVLFSDEYTHFVVAYLVIGGAMATLVFSLCVVSVPMLLDRPVSASTAMITSLRVVGHNLPAMALWGALIAGLTLLGFATNLIGMVVIMPILGHATWHAYKDLVH